MLVYAVCVDDAHSRGTPLAPTVTVAIVAYQSGDYLQACVDALARQTFPDFEAVIADNASTDGSVERLRLPDARFRVRNMGGNLGFAAGNNRVAFDSGAKWFATLNPDAQAEPAWLEQLLAAAGRHPDASSVGSTQIALDQPDQLDGAGDVWHAAGVAWRARYGRSAELVPAEDETFAACGAAALYDRAMFCALGGFDEDYFCYAEDVDMGFRLRLAGRTVVQAPLAVVRHAGSGVSGRTSEFTIFHGHRNRVWTFLKDTPTALLWWVWPYHLAMNVVVLLPMIGQGRGGTVLRAYAAALAGLRGVWRKRRQVQATRKVGAVEIGRQMAWSPLALLRRDVLGGRLPIQSRWLKRLRALFRWSGG